MSPFLSFSIFSLFLSFSLSFALSFYIYLTPYYTSLYSTHKHTHTHLLSLFITFSSPLLRNEKRKSKELIFRKERDRVQDFSNMDMQVIWGRPLCHKLVFSPRHIHENTSYTVSQQHIDSLNSLFFLFFIYV